MAFSCSKHLVRTIRATAKPLHYTVTVMPAGAEHQCSHCGKKAAWVVNEF